MMDEGQLNGQVAVVTGAARGIGAAISHELAGMGAHVYLAARDEERLDAIKKEIANAGGAATVAPCNLTSPEGIHALAERVKAASGRCDILVNCAGVATTSGPLHELALEEWDAMMDVNLRAPYLLIRALAGLMIAQKYGHIVNISSLAGKNPLPNGAAYSASKWGLNGLTYSVAEELRQYNIRVSAVAPGSVHTGFGGVMSSDEQAARKIQPEDVARVVSMIVTQAPQSFVSEVLLRPTMKP